MFGLLQYVLFMAAMPQNWFPSLSSYRTILWFVLFGLCLLSGLISLLYVSIPRRWLRVTVCGVYLVLMSGVLLLIGFGVVNTSEDCGH